MRFNGTGSNPSATESVGTQIARLEAENKKLRKAIEAHLDAYDDLNKGDDPAWEYIRLCEVQQTYRDLRDAVEVTDELPKA